MKVWIYTIGNEILAGHIVDTNSYYLAQNLEKYAAKTEKILSIADDQAVIAQAVREFIAGDADVLITTGGLGATHDDITREGISAGLGLPLVFSEDAHANLVNYYGRTEFSELDLRQALIISGAEVLPNAAGSAPAQKITAAGKTIFVLMGPRGENRPIIDRDVFPWFAKQEQERFTELYTLFGIPEADLEALLDPWRKQLSEVEVSLYASCGLIRAALVSHAERRLAIAGREFTRLVADYLICEGWETLEAVLARELTERKLTLAAAESITGGMYAARFTALPGASRYFWGSIVCYAHDAKTALFGLDRELLAACDAVGSEVSRELLRGLGRVSGADVTAAVTGFAGPTGEKVGYVAIAAGYRGVVIEKEFQFRGSREMIQSYACNNMTRLILELLKEAK